MVRGRTGEWKAAFRTAASPTICPVYRCSAATTRSKSRWPEVPFERGEPHWTLLRPVDYVLWPRCRSTARVPSQKDLISCEVDPVQRCGPSPISRHQQKLYGYHLVRIRSSARDVAGDACHYVQQATVDIWHESISSGQTYPTSAFAGFR
jgi:hypothetical protein